MHAQQPASKLCCARSIHLDRVEGLGDFLELEVLLSEDESSAAGIEVAHDLLKKLGIPGTHLVQGAYVDLLNIVD